MTQENNNEPKRRPYKFITPQTVAMHNIQKAMHGNGSRAVAETEPEYTDVGSRAYKIAKKSKSMPTLQYLDDSLQQIAAEGVRELGEMVYSSDERIKFSAIKYVIDHVRGSAVRKSISLTGKANIQSVLD